MQQRRDHFFLWVFLFFLAGLGAVFAMVRNPSPSGSEEQVAKGHYRFIVREMTADKTVLEWTLHMDQDLWGTLNHTLAFNKDTGELTGYDPRINTMIAHFIANAGPCPHGWALDKLDVTADRGANFLGHCEHLPKEGSSDTPS